MSISNEKAYEHAQDILHEQTYGEALRYADETVTSHQSTAPHDVLAVLAWEAYSDACDQFDISPTLSHFVDKFPTFAGLV